MEYLETKEKYCPLHSDNICKKFKRELEERGIECNDIDATRLKGYLSWKCENDIMLNKVENVTSHSWTDLNKMVPPEEILLPEHIKPESYEIWMWVKKEAAIMGNVTMGSNE